VSKWLLKKQADPFLLRCGEPRNHFSCGGGSFTIEMLIMDSNKNRHWEEDDLERYVMQQLPEAEAEVLELHLLVCESCRERLTETEDYVRSFEEASRRMRAREQEAPRWSWLTGWPRLAWAGALAGVIVAVIFLAGYPWSAAVNPVAVVLQASRSAEVSAVAPAGTPLVLQPDFSGLPVSETYMLEVVAADGSRIWQGSIAARASAAIPPQKAGLYFVRISSSSQQLLREYGLRVGQ
jgi:hypothetical protein